MWSVAFRIEDLGSRAQGLGLGVWGLESFKAQGVKSLGHPSRLKLHASV